MHTSGTSGASCATSIFDTEENSRIYQERYGITPLIVFAKWSYPRYKELFWAAVNKLCSL